MFLRLSGCNLSCSYCDTPGAREGTDRCTILDWTGIREDLPNPVEVAEAARIILSLWNPAMHSVSVTGGEPLLQAGELAGLLPLLKREGMGIYLETNGTLHEELRGLLPWIDWIAMDLKLPSTQGGVDLLEEHRRFLRLALSRRVFLKMVIDAVTGEEELTRACRRLGEEAGGVTLVLQPATPMKGEKGITPKRAAELHRLASGYFRDVRVIPQVHRLWGVR